MKATLEYKLPDEEKAFRLAVDGESWNCVVWAIHAWLRDSLEYGHKYGTPDEALQAVRDRLVVLINELSLEE